MDQDQEQTSIFSQADHQVAYVFHPEDLDAQKPGRPSKRRKVAQPKSKSASKRASSAYSDFVPLFRGAESAASVAAREKLFHEGWDEVNGRIQSILRQANSATLEQVKEFVYEAKADLTDKIPSAFITTGPDIAAQDLLFEQLSESLQQSGSNKFVRLRSADGTTLKATLKKIIREATKSKTSDADDEGVLIGAGKNNRRYLDYDLEALYALVRQSNCEHVFVAFQDSEGFDSGLLSDLIQLFNSWRPRIPFTLLFGIATSVDLLQARLLKTVCQLIHGAQFDVVQTATILDTVFRSAVAAKDVPVRLGAPLLRSLLDRQYEQVAGIQAFTSSIKYAYMCHFYANPLSSLQHLTREHLEAVRNTRSFRRRVEAIVERGSLADYAEAQSLLEDDAKLVAIIRSSEAERGAWIDKLLRSLAILEAAEAQESSFTDSYVHALHAGITVKEDSSFVAALRRLEAEDVSKLIGRAVAVLGDGDDTLRLEQPTTIEDETLRAKLEDLGSALGELQANAIENKAPLRSKYSGKSRVGRNTVIAQRVQYSQDSAALSDDDKKFTDIVDEMTKLLTNYLQVPSAKGVFLSESWLYESRSPLRDVLVPRPKIAFERSLTRPHDYLNCECCKPDENHDEGGGMQSTIPATSILYQMYLETGSLINVADLWSAFSALVGSEDDDADERRVLSAFYGGLAELRAMGYLKPSRKKMDHVAKVKWL